MIDMYAYETLADAVTDLRKRGFTVDFNLEENCLVCHEDKFHPQDF